MPGRDVQSTEPCPWQYDKIYKPTLDHYLMSIEEVEDEDAMSNASITHFCQPSMSKSDISILSWDGRSVVSVSYYCYINNNNIILYTTC